MEIADSLGLAGGRAETQFTPVDLAQAIEVGFPIAALDRIVTQIAPSDPALKHRLVPKATLARRRKSASRRLSDVESERVARLAEVWRLAVDVFGGDDKARAFLFDEHMLLAGQRPIDLAWRTGVGARAVQDVLGRLKYGSAI